MANASNSVAGITASLNKSYGAHIARSGNDVFDFTRVPTGLFALDLAVGGGFPEGKMSIVYGPESSGKTTVALLAIKNYQKRYPDRKCVFMDLEHAYDPKWAKVLGVDTDALVLVKPTYAEQAVDVFQGLMHADDLGLLVMDSIAMLVPQKEIANSTEKADVGGNALLVTRMMRRLVTAHIQADQEGRHPTVLLINQVRTEIGKMFGDPEKMPGGSAIKFMSSLTVRLYGKNVIDKSYSDELPARKEIRGRVVKYKVPVTATNFLMQMAVVPHLGFEPGQSDDWPTVKTYLQNLDMLGKTEDGKKWQMCGAEYAKLKDCEVDFRTNEDLAQAVRDALTKRRLQDLEYIDNTPVAE